MLGDESDRYDWRRDNLLTVVFVFVRALRDPVLAWDVAVEGVAAAVNVWDTFPGGTSRMAWVLDHAYHVMCQARESRRVSSQERRRNQVASPRTITREAERKLLDAAAQPLSLDAEAAAVEALIARGAPSPRERAEIALSPLTRRSGGGARERERG